MEALHSLGSKVRNIQPDVFKIDVEGAEMKVLESARGLLMRRPLRIVCEIHPEQMLHCGSSSDSFRSYLENLGCSFTPLDEPNPMGIFHGLIDSRSERATMRGRIN